MSYAVNKSFHQLAVQSLSNYIRRGHIIDDVIRNVERIITATCFSNVAVMGSLDVRLSVCDVGEQ